MTEDIPKPWFPIRTQRLLLREFRADDYDDIHDYASRDDVVRFMDWGPNTPAETREHLDAKLKEQAEWPRGDISLAVVVADEDKLIGSIRLGLQPHRNAEFGYSLSSAYWRKGYGYEAAHALVSIAFETLDIHRVWATCDVRNRGSFGIMEKLGMRREGTLRQNQPAREGGWRDTHLYAVLAQEWASRDRG